MVELVARRRMTYNSRTKLVGERFEARDRDAQILVASGQAGFAENERPTPPAPPAPEHNNHRGYLRRDESPSDEEGDGKRKRRRYRRRDMTAEDGE